MDEGLGFFTLTTGAPNSTVKYVFFFGEANLDAEIVDRSRENVRAERFTFSSATARDLYITPAN